MLVRVGSFLTATVLACMVLLASGVHVLAGDAVRDASDVKAAQQALVSLGYDVGVSDGVMGPRTSAAIRNFQGRRGIAVTGDLDTDTITALNALVQPNASVPAQPMASGAREPVANETSSASGGVFVIIFIGFIIWAVMRKRPRKVSKPARHIPPPTSAQIAKRLASGAHKPALRPSSLPQNGQPWVPFGQDVVVAGHTIRSGLVYVGTSLPQKSGYGAENCLINPTLPVASSIPNSIVANMPYWPSYSFIDAYHRLAYLSWLETGRNDPTTYIGYVFLYFYGLERRLMLDDPGTEAPHIITEVKRLLSIYRDNHSFNGYARTLLAAAEIKFDQATDWPVLDLSKATWQMPLDLARCIGRTIGEGMALNGEQMLAWYDAHPDKRLPSVARKCPAEFLTLFKGKFAAKFPNGIKVSAPKRKLSGSYRAASGTFTVEFSTSSPCPDISGLSAPLTQIEPLVEACTSELSTYARLIKRDASSRNAIAAAASLPAQLCDTAAAQPIKQLASWLDNNVQGGFAVLSAPELLSQIGVQAPPNNKIPKADMTLAAEALARCHYGIEPDPGNTYPSPASDGTIAVFAAEGGARLAGVGPEFLSALAQVDIGMLVAASDDVVAAAETKTLTEAIVRNGGLTPNEKKRLAARVAFLAKNPPSTRMLSQFKDRSAVEREAVARLAIAVATADGVLAPAELRLLEKIYKALQIPTHRLYSDLQGLNSQDEHVPTVAAADPSTSVPIPPRPAKPKSQPVPLDAEKLARTRADTAVVCSILGDIFRDDATEALSESVANLQDTSAQDTSAVHSISNDLGGLQPRYMPLVAALAGRSTISWHDFDALAHDHQLLCEGAIEAINDWSYTKFDAPLLDEGAEITINRELLWPSEREAA